MQADLQLECVISTVSAAAATWVCMTVPTDIVGARIALLMEAVSG